MSDTPSHPEDDGYESGDAEKPLASGRDRPHVIDRNRNRRRLQLVLRVVVHVVLIVVLACPVPVVTGTARSVPVLGWILGPTKMFPDRPIEMGVDASHLAPSETDDGPAVWVIRASDDKLLGISQNGTVDAGLDITETANQVVAGGGALWLLAGADLLRVDPRSGDATTVHSVSASPADFPSFVPDAIAWSGNRLWAIDDKRIATIGTEGVMTMKTTLPGDDLSSDFILVTGTRSGEDAAWVAAESPYDILIFAVSTDGTASEVARIEGMELAAFDAGGLSEDTMWFAARDKRLNRNILVKFDTSTEEVSSIEMRDDFCPTDVRAIGNSVWVRCGTEFQHIDSTGQVLAFADIYDELMTVYDWTPALNGDLWILIKDGASNSRVLRIPSGDD